MIEIRSFEAHMRRTSILTSRNIIRQAVVAVRDFTDLSLVTKLCSNRHTNDEETNKKFDNYLLNAAFVYGQRLPALIQKTLYISN